MKTSQRGLSEAEARLMLKMNRCLLEIAALDNESVEILAEIGGMI
ncbi:hypothetical protein [Baaleninema simplex]|nr:hypothetical protein [Baaleninema simplex]